jgi:hypothetical protein
MKSLSFNLLFMMITPFTQYLGLNILLLLEELIAYKFRDQDLKNKYAS